ncbi:hypothetical protein ACIBK9_13695 [Nonomuraea sp. NPDC050227]|uniref:hypothetical protein n=1 Tax=Nonomuraea sp. NPDC050227 TaxID=3364360 RepID=UPI0037A5F9AC
MSPQHLFRPRRFLVNRLIRWGGVSAAVALVASVMVAGADARNVRASAVQDASLMAVTSGNTSFATPTASARPTRKRRPTHRPTATPTAKPTKTPAPSSTPTKTATPPPTKTATPTPTKTATPTPTKSPTSTPIKTPTASASPATGSAIAARPNDGSGYWPDFSNTGYSRTPANAGGLGLGAYPGKLADYASGMSPDKPLRVEYPDNSVISFKRFTASKVYIYGDNLTFVGCLFEGTNPNDNLVQIYSDTNIKFLYSTFKPSSYTMPPGNDGKVSSAHAKPGTPFDKSWQLMTTMKEAVAVMDHNDIWGNAGLIMVTGFPGRPSTWTNNYIHDMADTARDVYHHDGIGPQSEGDGGHMIVNHNTLASLGNTNGLALQGKGVYQDVSVTNNYISGWGYALSIGTADNAKNITVSGNVFSAELDQLHGFLYGGIWGGTARGSTWRDNRIQARTGDGNRGYTPADNAKYLWPVGTAHATDYTG